MSCLYDYKETVTGMRGEMEIAYELLVKKHGKKKVMDTFARLSKA